jgi:O-glycosyl hydrolase
MKKAYLTAVMVLMLLLSQTAKSATVNVDLDANEQTIRGFGGMNFPRWIGDLTNAQVDTAFGNGPGQIGLTIMRIDIPYESGIWSGQYAAAKRAINNHGAIVFATPWTPPPSMKTNNDPCKGELRTDAYDDYADHLTAFANYMSSNGAPLFAVSVQNEPDWLPDYESCGWSPTQMQNFLNNNASVIPTRVIAPETVHYKEDYVSAVASSAECNIVGVHAYGGTITYYSGKEYWQTEHFTSSDVSGDLWPDALEVGKEIHDCMTANMNAYIWWYIRRSYGPIAEDGHVTKRGYVMSHFAKFARPGYVKVDATANPSSGVYVTAYKSGSTLVIVAVNQNSSSRSVTFSLSGGSVSSYTKYETSSSNSLSNMGSVGSTDTLAANSINTYVGTVSFEEDTTPPEPNQMTWALEPTATGESSIEMTATEANDISGVEYYFDCLTTGGHDSGWQDETYYEDTGLNPNTEYFYSVQARDKSPNQNETEWSSPWSETTWPLDTTPPEPNQMTWASEPNATGPSSIEMTATTAIDDNPYGVEYFFDCLTAGGHDSGWQDETYYEDTGLEPNTEYFYSVQARDKSINQNETEWSSELSATTEPPPTDIEILGSWVTGTTHAQEAGTSRALLFIAHAEHNDVAILNSVTYGGQEMNNITSEIAGTGYRAYVTAYILDEAGIDAASGDTFALNWSTAPGNPENFGYASVFLENVNQADPIGEFDENSVTDDTRTITTSSLSTEDGDMVIVAATCGNGNPGDYTVNNGFTEAIEHDMDSSTGVDGYKSATGASETPSVTFESTVNRQVIIGFVVQAAEPNEIRNCSDVQTGGYGLLSDLTGDCYVDYDDLDIVANYWLYTDCGSYGNCEDADFEPTDGTVDFYDLSDFALQWMQCNDPEGPESCIENW